MLKKLFDYIAPKNDRNGAAVIPANQHGIATNDISPGSKKVIQDLQGAGYEAYLVGGGVRDLILGGRPKDFDVATNATPEQVNSIFRKARIIGRRFQIVHVRMGREIIEVTTFRGSHTAAGSETQAKQSEHGVLLRDNVYGNIQSDAVRRDFTINALYYDPTSGNLFDFCNGLQDLKTRTLRIIGDPEDRYKEDPVRLIRAVRFAAKLGFTLSPETEQPIREHADYLSHIPPARLFEEMLKLFFSGSATAVMTLLRDYQLLAYLLPGTDYCLEKGAKTDLELVMSAATNTDKRLRQNQRVTPAFIYAALLWPPMRAQMRHYTLDHGLSTQDAMQRAAQGVITQQLSFTAIPKRFLIPMREIWSLQLRFSRREGKRAYALMEHPRFRAAYDFLLLREQSGENLNGLGMWWTTFQTASQEEREGLIAQAAAESPRAKPKRSRRRKRPNTENTSHTNTVEPSPQNSGD